MTRWKYMVRVAGLGNVQALFLSSASNDETARADAQLCERMDIRRRNVALYKIECLIDELGDAKDYPRIATSVGKSGTCTYLVTGRHLKDLREMFYEAPEPLDAILEARSLRWNTIRIYQCEQIAL